MSRLEALVAGELAEPVDPRVRAMAAAIAGRYGDAARAVLFYGSCLRAGRLEGAMLDFYLIVSSYRAAYGRSWLAAANRAVPPNVFPFAHDGLVAKYAVMSEADFRRDCGPEARTVSIWARFAQPSRLVWGDPAAVVPAIIRAAPTLLCLVPEGDPLERWRQGLALTYGCELRAESTARPGAIIDADPERYRRFGEAADVRTVRDARAQWRRLRRRGKGASILRLAKASLTYAGGVDYIAWKISRHAGTPIVLRPWQRRHPIIAGILMLPRLLRSGAVR